MKTVAGTLRVCNFNLPQMCNLRPALTGRRHFWRAFDAASLPRLRELHDAGAISAVLPFDHAPLKLKAHGSQEWSACVLVVGTRGVEVSDLAGLARTARDGTAGRGELLAVDQLTLQPNLEMFYPERDGPRGERRLFQFIEYVVSDPAYRVSYYPQQYLFSGPAMRSLHRANRCGRFIGFEVVERLDGLQGTPRWDVLHVSGFSARQMLHAGPHFRNAWQRQAETVFGPDADARAIMGKEWDRYRVKATARARQRMASTLQSPSLTI